MDQKDWEAVEPGSSSRSHSSAINLSIQLPNSLDDDEDSLIQIIPPVNFPIKTDNGKPQGEKELNEPSAIEPLSCVASERTSPSSIPPSQMRQTTSDPLAAASSNVSGPKAPKAHIASSSPQNKLTPSISKNRNDSEGNAEKSTSPRKNEVPSASSGSIIKGDVDMLIEELLLIIPPGAKAPTAGRLPGMICRVYVMNRWFKVNQGK